MLLLASLLWSRLVQIFIHIHMYVCMYEYAKIDSHCAIPNYVRLALSPELRLGHPDPWVGLGWLVGLGWVEGLISFGSRDGSLWVGLLSVAAYFMQ